MQDAKMTHKKSPSGHHRPTLSGYIFATKACIDNRKKNLLSSDMSSTRPHNMVNFGLLTAEICWQVWGTPANFNGFRVLAALLHGTLVVDVSQTLRHWTEGAIYIQQGSHDVSCEATARQIVRWCADGEFFCVITAALHSRCGHYIFVLFLSFFFALRPHHV